MESTKYQWKLDECLSTEETLSTFYRHPFGIKPSKAIRITNSRFELFTAFLHLKFYN